MAENYTMYETGLKETDGFHFGLRVLETKKVDC